MAPNKLAITTKTWDEARIARLAQLWREGYSAEDIASALGGTTRNAVLGKIHRLGIQDTAGARAPQTDRTRLSRFRPTMPSSFIVKRGKSGAMNRAINVALRVQAARLPELPAPLPLPADPAPAAASSPVGMLDLEPHHCKFPLGDPRNPAFKFCGADRLEGRPYCSEHTALCYVRGSNARTIGLPRSLIGRAA